MAYTLAVITLLVLVAVFVLRPLGRGASSVATEGTQRAELEAAKQAKYAEIRDAELDFRTAKLSEADYRVLDRALRAEAIGILRAIDDLGPTAAGVEPGSGVERPGGQPDG